jgi:hypothetical protein
MLSRIFLKFLSILLITQFTTGAGRSAGFDPRQNGKVLNFPLGLELGENLNR